MRIGIICHPSVGGSGLIATQLGIGLADKGHEVHFISSIRPFRLWESYDNIRFHQVDAIDYPLFEDPLYTFALTAKIVEVFEQYDLDIIHAHYSIPHSLCAYLASEITSRSFPIVTTIHGTDVTVVGQNQPLYPLNKFSIEKSDTVTTVSNFQREYTREHFSITKPIRVIYNFIDMDTFTPECFNPNIRKTLAGDDEKIIMHVSNFRPLKNTQMVVSAFAEIQKIHKARLILLGDGPDVEKTKQQCEALGITEKVNFLGSVKEVENYIANADCLFQPSYNESFSLVALEAMACGVPIVASNVDGIPEVVVHNETGLLASPDDQASMVANLTSIISDAGYASNLGKNGRKRAVENFSWEAQVEQYIECYQETLFIHQSNIAQSLTKS